MSEIKPSENSEREDESPTGRTVAAIPGARAAFEAMRRLRLPRLVLAIDGRLLWASGVVGAAAGLIAVAYYYALMWLIEKVAWVEQRGLPVWALMPAAGAVIGLLYVLGNPGETDELVNNIHLDNGQMQLKANLPLVPISLLSIAAGGSAGPEAPMVHLTGSAGTLLHRIFKLPEQGVRALTFAGMSVGFATLFGAPVGSALFALEIPHRRGLEYYEALLPALVGCLVGYAIFSGLTHHGLGFTWTFPPYQLHHYMDLGYALVVGLACGAAAMLFVVVIRALRRVFKGMHKRGVPRVVLGALGGLALGILAWRMPLTRYWGEGQLQAVAPVTMTLSALLYLAGAKMLAVSTTLASGWKGGIIIPCFLIGACLGKALALVIPGLDPTLAMVCGMAAVNIAVMKVPLGTVLVVVAMSGVNAVGPVAIAAIAAFLITGGVNVIDAKQDRAAAQAVVDARSAPHPIPTEAEPQGGQAIPIKS
jgi:H+/Cl- antiporter ClcA